MENRIKLVQKRWQKQSGDSVQKWVQSTSKVEIRRFLCLDCRERLKDGLIKLVGGVSMTTIKFQKWEGLKSSKTMTRKAVFNNFYSKQQLFRNKFLDTKELKLESLFYK